ncbi:MAG: kumamolisin [Streptomyces sp.]|nr:kumamolisin [Streptomyces sp.]
MTSRKHRRSRKKAVAGVVALAVSATGAAYAFSSAFAAPVSARVALSHDVVAAVTHSTETGKVASSKKVAVTVSFTPRDQTGLDAFIAKVADPKATQYKHYLTVKQFASRYGATATTVAKTTTYLKSQGLTVGTVSANHLSLGVSGSAAKVEKAFGTTLAKYRENSGKHTYFANTAAPTLPADLAPEIADVSGLNDYAKYHRNTEKAPHASSKAVSGLTPTKARKAYNLTSTISGGYDGTGSTVGLLEFSAFDQSDIDTYDSQFSLSPSTPTVVNAGGGTTDTSGQDEVDLDIEVVQALAPGADIKVYEAPNSDAGETAVYAKLVSDNVPVISISWGINEAGETSSNRTALNTDFKEAAAQGQSVYAASGDNGSDDAGTGGTSVDFPAADPYVTGTGGTKLTTTSTGTYTKETGWTGSGGGVSTLFATPAYQSSVNTGSKRTVPDVSADADPASGWAVHSGGSWGVIGGTSGAAPNWAAFTAVYNSEVSTAFGYANSTIYTLASSSSYSSAFHDVTSGSNGSFSSATGYDKVTGWGSYNGANFIAAELG